MTSFRVTDHRIDGTLTDAEAGNRKLVLDCYQTQWRTRDFDRVRHHFTDDFVDHNPDVPGGNLDGLAKYFAEFQERFPDIELEIRRVIVDGDFVALHVRGRLTPDAPADSVMEIFRLNNGRLAEHWEVVQSTPQDSPNPVAMF